LGPFSVVLMGTRLAPLSRMASLPLLSLLVLLAAAPAWHQEVLSDQAEVRASALSHLHARGRSGLYAMQGLVEASDDPSTRARAVRALGELGDPEAEWELRLQLKQSSPHVIAAVVRAAQRLNLPGLARAVADKVGDPDPELCEALAVAAPLYPAIAQNAREALEGNGPRQLAGLRVLRAAGLPVPEPLARRLSASPLAEVRLAAAESLAAADSEAAVQTIAALLSGPVADRAIEALGTIGTPPALSLLEGLLGRADLAAPVLAALARSAAGERILIKRRSALSPGTSDVAAIDAAIAAQPRTPELLLELLGDPEAQVADAAAATLGRSPTGRAALESCLERLSAQASGQASHCAAGLAASPEASAEIARALESLEPAVRASMVTGLGANDRHAAIEMLGRMATDPSPEVRVALATAAGRLGDRGVDLLMTLVRDSQPVVRSAAAVQLIAVIPADRLRVLASEAVADPAVRAPMFKALDRLPIHDSLRILRASLQDPDGSERRQALLALAQFHVPEAINVLMDSAARETDPALRELAYSMLANQ